MRQIGRHLVAKSFNHARPLASRCSALASRHGFCVGHVELLATDGVKILPLGVPKAGLKYSSAIRPAIARTLFSIHHMIDRVRRGLQMKQLGVLSTKSHQLIVSAMLDHPSMIKYIDPVGGPYGGEPVRNDQGAAPPQHLVQRREEL